MYEINRCLAFHQWAVRDATQEVLDGFPRLLALKSPAIANYLHLMGMLTPGEQIEYARVIVNAAHPVACNHLGLVNSQIDVARLAKWQENRGRFLESNGAMYTKPAEKIGYDTQDLSKALASELRARFGRVLTATKPKGWEFVEEVSQGRFVRTSFRVRAQPSPFVVLLHSFLTSRDERVGLIDATKHRITSLPLWLGIGLPELFVPYRSEVDASAYLIGSIVSSFHSEMRQMLGE